MTDLFGNPTPIVVVNKRGRRKYKTNPLLSVFGSYNKEPGQKCKNCEHFQRFRQSKTWFKCGLRKKGGPATDHRANYQACGRFVAITPSCPGCGAERLTECNCPPQKKEA